MRVLSFSGSPRAIGTAFGETCRDQIHEFYRLRVNNALQQAEQHGGRSVSERTLLGVAEASIAPTEAYDAAGLDELRGIAEGAGLTLAQILAMNGLTDYRDVLAWNGELEAFGGCSSFVVAKDRSANGHTLVGQTWDLATDNMPFVVGVIRHVTDDDGRALVTTRSLTTVGCLTLIGMSSRGLAVGTTNLRTHDARPGVNYLSILHRAIHAADIDEAVAAVRDAPRAGAHYYSLVDGDGHARAVETSAEHCHVDVIDSGTFVHCNHCLVPAHQEIEASTPAASSHARQARMEALLSADALTLDDTQRFLADTENGENAICRDDFNGISSNGAVVMDPQSRVLRACHGMPDRATWIELGERE